MKALKIILLAELYTILPGCNNTNPPHTVMDKGENATDTTTTSLQWETQRYDFGTVDKARIKNVRFDIGMKNLGDKPIAIQKVDVSCGCMKAEFAPEPILPSQDSKLSVNINTGNLLGQFSKVLFVTSTASREPQLIRIVGRITE